MKKRYLGILVAAAIVGLSLGDALTGHGIKGNKNLNPLVVGNDSSGGSSSSSSSSSGGNGKCRPESNVNWISPCSVYYYWWCEKDGKDSFCEAGIMADYCSFVNWIMPCAPQDCK